MKDRIDELRKYWFKDHEAKLEKQGDLEILKWRNPKSINYYIKYVFDNENMYVTGDLGSAVFNLTWKSGIHNFNDITNLEYFIEKLSAFSNNVYDFNNEIAKERLEEWKDEILDDYEFEIDEKEKFLNMMDYLIGDILNCTSKDDWAYTYVNGEYNEFISKYDIDYWEWIYDIGNIPNIRIVAYLIGLQMASEQLKESEK